MELNQHESEGGRNVRICEQRAVDGSSRLNASRCGRSGADVSATERPGGGEGTHSEQFEYPQHEAASEGGRVLTDISYLGGTGHQAMVANRSFPSTKALLAAIPEACYQRSLARSLAYAGMSVLLTLLFGLLGYRYLWDLSKSLHKDSVSGALWTRMLVCVLWSLYAAVTGTVATGAWVAAHECGHGAFCDNAWLQNLIGFMLHSSLLVPYFSWQRSHAVHHARTNHLDEGETHVPHTAYSVSGQMNLRFFRWLGDDAFGALNVFMHLLLGWPAYLVYGATGGPVRGMTNHFIPLSFGQGELQSTKETLAKSVSLFPGWRWKLKVLLSDLGVLAMLALLYYWARHDGVQRVLVVYGMPYLVTNMWLVLYTWLQHTDVDIPHYDSQHWSWNKGALLTVDRPYPKIVDFLHHHIGTLKTAFPDHYLYDPTPIHRALWRVGANCFAVRQIGDLWVYSVANSDEEMHERAFDVTLQKAKKMF
ncbi:linoleoyl-CoA desaturase [Cyanidiococcus yangmingshanensis]|uniref:Linoleoyl-CoA desaturase n=1 Tax=Cyanidiococcus yangmingshanensis TaxID=2690220 RepID=A0A7J7IHY6_9RHOD|nr:linoleoyl-CoA desaturase [Cyanidiococcus yangmingshanensis]